jgi:cell division protease FtsH
MPPPFSQKTAEGIDAEVKKLVDEAYVRAERLINENRDKLETLAGALLEKESMDGRDIEELLGLEKKQ